MELIIVYDIIDHNMTTGCLVHINFVFIVCYCLQPVSGPYDDSFEKLNLDADGWRSKRVKRVIVLA